MKLISLVEQKNILGHLPNNIKKGLMNNFDTIFSHDLKNSVSKGFNMKDPNTGRYVPVKNGKELHTATVNNLLDDISLSKVNIGLFKTNNVPEGILDSLSADIVLSNKFNEKYGKYTHDIDALRKELYRNGYSKEGTDAILKKINPYLHSSFKDNADVTKQIEKNTLEKNRLKSENQLLTQRIKELEAMSQSQAVDVISKTTKNDNVTKNTHLSEIAKNSQQLKRAKASRESVAASNTSKVIYNLSPKALSKFQRVKPKLKSKFWLYLGGLSGLAAGGWYLWSKLTDGDVNDPQKSIGPKCLTDLLDEPDSSVGHTKTGDPVVIVKNTGNPDFDKSGGLIFFTNNRVQLGKTTKRGTWGCKGSSLSLSENKIKTLSLNEQFKKLLNEAVITQDELGDDVNKVIDYLDFPVYGNDLKNTYNILLKYKNGTVNGKPADKEFLDLYKRSGLGRTSLETSLSYVLTNDAKDAQLKDKILDLVTTLGTGHVTQTNPSNKGINGISITWDGEKQPTSTNTPQGSNTTVNRSKLKIDYRPCTDFPFSFGCVNEKIGEIQKCVGVEPSKGYFGHKTFNHLKNVNGYDMSNGITEEMYNEIMANCTPVSGETQQIDNTVIDNSVNTQTNSITTDDTQSPTNTVTTNDGTVVTNDTSTNIPSLEQNSPPIDEELYYQLINKKRLKGKLGDRRIKYKGEDLSEEEMKTLNEFFKRNNYRLIKNKDKGHQYTGGEDDKYVWLKNRDSRKS